MSYSCTIKTNKYIESSDIQDIVDNLTKLCYQLEGKSFPANAESIPLMYQELSKETKEFFDFIL